MGKQGLKGTQSDVYLYQELDSNVSVAVGLEDASDSFVVSLSVLSDADPGGTKQLVIDSAANGNITLAPNGTGTVDVTTTVSMPTTSATEGVIFINAARFAHAFLNNTCVGLGAGNFTATPGQGIFNTCVGVNALDGITTGERNTGVGHAVMRLTTSGCCNTAVGYTAGNGITTGDENICVGHEAGISLTTGSRNIVIESVPAVGIDLADSDNIIIGDNGVSGDNNTIRIGSSGSGNNQQNRCFIGGIRGITTGNADAIAVLIDSASQLGTVSSSIRHKENIEDLGATTDKIYDLRPVSFNYKVDESKKRQYGLIAEEVKEIYPDLVVNDEEGLPLSIKYHDLPVLLLNEIQRLKKEITALKASMPYHM